MHKLNNEIFEIGQIISVRASEVNQPSDSYCILKKKIYDNNNQQVWEIWWSDINKSTYCSFDVPQPIEPIEHA